MNPTTRTHRDERSGGSATAFLRVGEIPVGPRAEAIRVRMHQLQVEAAMKPVPTGIGSAASLEEAEEQMDSAGVNWLPVLDRGRIVGLITRLDIRQALASRGYPR